MMAFAYLYVCLSALALVLSIQAHDGISDQVTQHKKATELGRYIVRRQAEEDNNVTACQSFENANYTEPKACPFEGEEFPLCEAGKRKIGKCIKDRDDYCVSCNPGETFMVKNNNCTSCTPCKTCASDEQIAVACTLFDDTQCEPRPTTTVGTDGLTTPQQEVTTATLGSRTSASAFIEKNQQDATSPVKYKDLDPPVFLSTANPECKCNCSSGGVIAESTECSKYLIFYIVCIILLILLIIIVLLLVCGAWKYKKLEKENKTLKQKLEQNGNYSTVTKEKSNEDSSNHQGYKKLPDEDIEMTVRSKPPDDGDNRNQNGNTSQVDVIDEKADNSLIGSDADGLEPPYAQVGNEQTQADKSINESSLVTPKQSPIPKLSVNKTDNNESLPIPVMTEEEEEKEKSGLETLDPDYDRADPDYDRADPPADRRSRSVRGRIESTPTSDPPPLPVRNKALQRSQTFNSPFDSTSPSINVKADVHANKDVKTEEPAENHPFLSQGTADSDANTETTPAIISTLKRFFPSTRKRSKDTEGDGKVGDETATDTSNINIEDLYAKVDKSRKRNPNPESTDSSDEPETSSIFQKVNFQKMRANSAANGDSKPAPSNTNVSGGIAPLDKVTSDLDFENITRTLTANILYSLYSQLGLNESTVERIETESNSTMISVFQEWRNRKGKRATRKALVQALRKGGHNMSAVNITKLFTSDADNLPESCV